jgi:hypothetical protein
MDVNSVTVIVIAIFAIVIALVLVTFRRRATVGLKGPLGMRLDVDASNEPMPGQAGVRVTDALSHGGGLRAADLTGRGAEVERVETEGDIEVSSAQGSDLNPKAARRIRPAP